MLRWLLFTRMGRIVAAFLAVLVLVGSAWLGTKILRAAMGMFAVMIVAAPVAGIVLWKRR